VQEFGRNLKNRKDRLNASEEKEQIKGGGGDLRQRGRKKLLNRRAYGRIERKRRCLMERGPDKGGTL